MDENTLALIEKTAEAAATNAVMQTLTTLGFDTARPLEVQRDMASLHEIRIAYNSPAFQQDMLHLRKWRLTMEQVRRKSILGAAGMIGLGIVAVVVLGFEQLTGK